MALRNRGAAASALAVIICALAWTDTGTAQVDTRAEWSPIGRGARLFITKCYPGHGQLSDRDFEQLATAGFTVAVHYWTGDTAAYSEGAAKQGLAAMKWLHGPAPAEDEADRTVTRAGERTQYWQPWREEGWAPVRERLLGLARLSVSHPNLRGAIVDFEIYDRNKTDGFCESYDEAIFLRFLNDRGITPPSPLPGPAERQGYLEHTHQLDAFIKYQQDLVAEQVRKIRREIDAINPYFQVGVYGWGVLCEPVLENVATPRAPALACDAMTYGRSIYSNAFEGGYDADQPDRVGLRWSMTASAPRQREVEGRYKNVVFLAGHYPQSSGPVGRAYEFTVRQSFNSAAYGHGYWIWTDWITPEPWPSRQAWIDAMMAYWAQANHALDAGDFTWAQRQPAAVPDPEATQPLWIVTGQGGLLRVWDGRSGQQIQGVEVPDAALREQGQPSWEGMSLRVSGWRLAMVDPRTGKVADAIEVGSRVQAVACGDVDGVAGEEIVTLGGGWLKLWDPRSKAELLRIPVDAGVRELHLVSPEKLIRVGGASDRMFEPEASKGREIRAIYPKTLWHTGGEAKFSEDVLQHFHALGFSHIGPMPRGRAGVTLGRRAEKIGMKLYGTITPCWSIPEGAPWKDERMVWFNGYEQAVGCPASERFWEDVLIGPCVEYAYLAREHPLEAVLLDWEIYNTPKFRNVYATCFCGECVQRYRQATGSRMPDLPADQRHAWLDDQGEMSAYQAHFLQRVETLARKLRAAMDAVHPELSIFLIPTVDEGFLTAVARGVASEAAPVWVANEATYGKPTSALNLPDDVAIESNVTQCLRDRAYLDGLGIPYRYLAATYNNWGSAAFHGRALIRMAEVADGYWFFEDPYQEPHRREDYYRAYAHANAEIMFGTFEDPWRWREESEALHAPAVPPGRTGVGLAGLGGAAKELFSDERFAVYPAPDLSADAMGDTRLLILENYNASLDADSPIIRYLREFVEGGGALLLTHDSAYFMASPFPEIVVGPGDPPEKGDPRHILDTQLRVADDAGDMLGTLAGMTYEASFNDHLVFDVGSEGRVLVRDRYGYPVIVAGSVGKGRVIFSGCYYSRLKSLDSDDARMLRQMVQWLLASD